MSQCDGLVPSPPDGVRPAQLGVVMLGRVIIGDIGATLVDLAIRQLLDVQEADREGTDWLLTPLDSSASVNRRESVLGYERTLLHGLRGGGSAVVITWLRLCPSSWRTPGERSSGTPSTAAGCAISTATSGPPKGRS